MCAQLGGDIVDAESGRGGVPNHAGDEGAQLTAVMVGRLRLLRRRGDERPDAAPGLDDAGPLELGVDARDGVGIDAQLDRQLPQINVPAPADKRAADRTADSRTRTSRTTEASPWANDWNFIAPAP